MGVKADQVAPPGVSPKDLLRTFFQRESDSLKPSLRRYVAKAGLAKGQPIDEVVEDLWQDVVVQALKIADRFDVSRPPAPWVFKIALHLINRRRVEQAKRHRLFVVTANHPALDPDGDGEMEPGQLFDLLAKACDNPEEFLAGRQQTARLLDLLSPSDRLLVTNDILLDMDGDELAAALKIAPGAARVRLHRAFERLRKALSEQAEGMTP